MPAPRTCSRPGREVAYDGGGSGCVPFLSRGGRGPSDCGRLSTSSAEMCMSALVDIRVCRRTLGVGTGGKARYSYAKAAVAHETAAVLHGMKRAMELAQNGV
jgi:hypothetical protein